MPLSLPENFPTLRASICTFGRAADTQHRVFALGPIRQQLVMRLAIPASADQAPALIRGTAALRLQLSNKMLYSLQLTGPVDEALRHTQALAAWLLAQPYDEHTFRPLRTRAGAGA